MIEKIESIIAIYGKAINIWVFQIIKGYQSPSEKIPRALFTQDLNDLPQYQPLNPQGKHLPCYLVSKLIATLPHHDILKSEINIDAISPYLEKRLEKCINDETQKQTFLEWIKSRGN